jgi:glutaredoxin
MMLLLLFLVAFCSISLVFSFSSTTRLPRRIRTYLEVATDYDKESAPVTAIAPAPDTTAIAIDATPSTSIDSDNRLLVGWNIFMKGMSSGDGFKQSLADAFSGPDLDLDAANKKIDDVVSSNPCVVFSWTMSPFSKKAKKHLADIGVKYTTVELDQPWSEGNPIRSALGRRVGRTSVPAIFIGGKYVGGCEDGPSDECPGIVQLAFQGRLRPMLIEAGALDTDISVDFVPSYARRAIVSEGGVSYKTQSITSEESTKTSVTSPPTTVKSGFEDLSVNNSFDDDCPSDDACELP